MNRQSKVLYTATIDTIGGAPRSAYGNLDGPISSPDGRWTDPHPEHFFAAGWLSCFESAIGIAARKKKVTLPSGFAIDADVDVRLVDGFFTISARLNVRLPGLPREAAQELVDEAYTLCPEFACQSRLRRRDGHADAGAPFGRLNSRRVDDAKHRASRNR